MMQCPPTLLDMGHSPTGTLVYRVFLADTVLAVASNNWRAQVRALPLAEDRAWLEANSVVIDVSAPLWVKDEPAAACARV